MKQLVGVSALAIVGSSFGLGQPGPPEKWVGTWTLNTQKSTFGAILLRTDAPGLTIVSQTMRIEQTARELRLSGDIVMSDGSRSNHEEGSLSLDGRETALGPGPFPSSESTTRLSTSSAK